MYNKYFANFFQSYVDKKIFKEMQIFSLKLGNSGSEQNVV